MVHVNSKIHSSEVDILLAAIIFFTMDQVWKRKYLNTFFHHRILLGENIFKYIFTTVFCWEKIYFHHRILLVENIFEYIFTTVFLGEKIYLNIFSPPYFWGRKYI